MGIRGDLVKRRCSLIGALSTGASSSSSFPTYVHLVFRGCSFFSNSKHTRPSTIHHVHRTPKLLTTPAQCATTKLTLGHVEAVPFHPYCSPLFQCPSPAVPSLTHFHHAASFALNPCTIILQSFIRTVSVN